MATSYCLPRPKKFPPFDSQPGDESYYTDYHEWNDDGCCKHCKVTRRQAKLDAAAGAVRHPIPRAPDPIDEEPPPGEPAFYIEVILGSHYGDLFPRISWHCPGGFNRPMRDRQKLLGRYACHRVPAIGIDAPLLPMIEPKVELDVDLAVRILEAFTSGTVASEDVAALRAAIRSAP